MVSYTQLLKKVYIKAKQVDPDCKILNGGLAKTIPLYLKKIYQNGGKGYFDILAIHPFVHPLYGSDVYRVKGLYNACKKIMQESGDDKNIWFTEIGVSGVKALSPSNTWWLGDSLTEEQQAVWVRRLYKELLSQLADYKIF
ncbi:MAG: hypothetical protein NC904_08435 [Candidatus Omnitrophica bacterium]|nr:hypothetical protein [Candidatus Omnitrophota bacterium]